MSDMTHCTRYNLTGQIQTMNYNIKLVEVPMLHYSRHFCIYIFTHNSSCTQSILDNMLYIDIQRMRIIPL